MGIFLAQLPEKIKKHLQSVLERTELPKDEQSLELLAENWIGKHQMFDSMIKSLVMQEIESFSKNDIRPALLITYSGSLIGLGPLKNDGRWLEYASIKLRANVPDIAVVKYSGLKEEIIVNGVANFTAGEIKNTSALFKIAVCAMDVNLNEQEKRIKEAMIYLTNAFVKLNRNTFTVEGEAPEQFNLASMVRFIANKNHLTQKQTKAVLSDMFSLIETGILLGERVALGRLGSISLKLHPPRKPRVIKKFLTGGELTIPALPERFMPKMHFSKRLKKRSSEIKP